MLDNQETAQFDYSDYVPDNPEDLVPGMFLGRENNYRLEKFLGAGSMGYVWLATEIENGLELRKVVCKVLPTLVQKEKSEMKKVLKTFHLVQPLSHPNICPIYGLKSDPVCGYFFVMGYADGGTLTDWVQSQPDHANGLPFSQVVSVLRPIAQGLDYAHEMGIVHRDVNPKNILFVTRRDRKVPWLIDFGISFQIQQTTTYILSVQDSSGTPAYMAPEQCQNEKQDGRTDQYSLAVLAYQLLSGHLPFQSDNPIELWRQIVNKPAPPLTNVPPEVNAVLMRALSKNRKSRFSSCVEFVDALTGKQASSSSAWSVLFWPILFLLRLTVFPIYNALNRSRLKWPLVIGLIVLMLNGLSFFNVPTRQTSPTESENVISPADESDFVMEGSTLIKYKGQASALIIPSVINGQKVTKIEENAFRNCASLTSVVIPEGVTEIGKNAFQDCSSLKTVVIPKDLTIVYDAVFPGCPKLKIHPSAGPKPEYANKIQKPAKNKRKQETAQRSGNEPSSQESIPRTPTSRASFEWDGTKIRKFIGEETEVVIPDGTTEIEDRAFYNCHSVKSVIIPEGVTKIGANTFWICNSLTFVEIPQSMSEIGDSAFRSSAITSIVIPENVTKIGEGAFYGCHSLTSVVISEGVIEIGGGAFMDCTSLKFVLIPEGVTEIGSGAFKDCRSLTSVIIPESVKEIDYLTFTNCSRLTIHAPKGSAAERYALRNTIPFEVWKEQNPGIENEAASGFTSRQSFEWDGRSKIKKFIGKEAEVVIPKGVTVIDQNAFYGCNSLTSVTIPNTVKVIGDGAFACCPALKKWGISSTHSRFKSDGVALLSKDGKKVIACLASAEKYQIPEGVTEIGNKAFFDCSFLKSVTIPESVKEIGTQAFSGCSSLTSIDIPEKVKKIKWNTFRNCRALESLVIPESVTEIEASAFYGCSSLTSVEISEGVTKIGSHAFSGCNSLTSAVIPESVVEIENMAFAGCPNLTINAPRGSKAEEYARKNEISFEVKQIELLDRPLDDEDDPLL